MANKEIGASLNLDAEKANRSVKSFKTELREAQAELMKMSAEFGETSTQAVAAAKRVAQLKDSIGDAKALVDGFNPDRKFQALSGAISGVAGGFAALQGVMALVGAESEDVQKSLLKVQAALAISQGVNSILELKDTFTQLATVVKSSNAFIAINNALTKAAAFTQKLFGFAVDQTSVSFKVLKGAIAATGIGLLVIAISEAVTALMEWANASEEAAEKQKALHEQTKKLADAALEGEMDFVKREERLAIERAKARGASEEEIFNIQVQWLNQRKKSLGRYYEEVKDADEKAADEAVKQAKDLNVDREVLRLQFEASQRKKREEEAKKRLEEEKARRKKLLEELMANEKLALDQIKKLKQEAELAAIANDDERRRRQIKLENQNERERVNSIRLTAKTRLALIQEINRTEEAELAALDREALEKKKQRDAERLAANLEFMTQALEQAKMLTQAQNDLRAELATFGRTELEQQLFELDEWYKARQKIAGDNEALQNQLTAEYERQRTAIVKQEAMNRLAIVSSILGRAADLFGKQTAAGKALAIAEATINTYAGATQALRSKVAAPEPLATAIRIAQAALIVATGIKSIKEIIKTKVPGTGGASASLPQLEANAPLTPQVGSTTLDQDALNNQGNAAVRAFVVETDVENNRERIERLNRAARLGG
jgi:hypothetical protein